MNTELASMINRIQAIETVKGFRIEAVLETGAIEVIRKNSKKRPDMVQLYNINMNGNFWGDGIGKYFSFAKSVNSNWKHCHIKSFLVS